MCHRQQGTHYRFTVTLQDNPLAQAKSVTVTFTWEAQNL